MTPIKIEKTVVLAKSRMLKATWTMEKIQDGVHDINDEISKILQEEIDREILNKIKQEHLKSQGYAEVSLSHGTYVDPEWCNTYIKQSYSNFGHRWYFSDERDATLFTLKWSTQHNGK